MAESKVGSLLFTDEQLAAMNRDIRFFPSKVESPKTLTRQQVDQYNSEGYVKGISIYSDDEIAEIRRWFDGKLQETIAQGQDSYSIITAHLKYGMGYDILSEPRIVACAKDILGDNVIGWGTHFMCKMPGDGKRVSWHQDASYWPFSPSKTVTAWLAIDDANTENGCMRVIPRSHLHGQLDYRQSDDSEHNVLNQTIDAAEQYGSDPVDIDLKAGQISLHSDLLLHGSEANLSQRRRCGLTLRYCAADVRSASPEWAAKGIVVSGTDPDQHWANPPRPSSN